jgi:N-methylhydantoinase B/oxoprolinase/acetone carboxylase alpha subunit
MVVGVTIVTMKNSMILKKGGVIMSKLIYVLRGSTGEYSDRTDWIVRAYTDKIIADAHCSLANQQADDYKKAIETWENSVEYINSTWEEEQEMIIILRNKHLTADNNARIDYTGTSYWVEECFLHE